MDVSKCRHLRLTSQTLYFTNFANPPTPSLYVYISQTKYEDRYFSHLWNPAILVGPRNSKALPHDQLHIPLPIYPSSRIKDNEVIDRKSKCDFYKMLPIEPLV
jgi:hypothetical protein